MLRHLFLFLCLIPFTFTGCGGLTCPPTADLKQQEAIEAMAASIAFNKPRSLNTPGHVRIPLAKGQWVTTLTRYKAPNGDRSLSTTKVIDVEGDLVTLEVENYTASGNAERNLTLVQLAGYPINLPLGPDQEALNAVTGKTRIVRMVTQAGSNPPSEMPPMALQFASGLMQKFINPAIRTTAMSTRPAETPYLKARDAREFDVQVSVMGIQETGKTQAHGGVPISSQMLYENGDQVSYTIAYDMKGAEQRLFFPETMP